MLFKELMGLFYFLLLEKLDDLDGRQIENPNYFTGAAGRTSDCECTTCRWACTGNGWHGRGQVRCSTRPKLQPTRTENTSDATPNMWASSAKIDSLTGMVTI